MNLDHRRKKRLELRKDDSPLEIKTGVFKCKVTADDDPITGDVYYYKKGPNDGAYCWVSFVESGYYYLNPGPGAEPPFYACPALTS